MRILHLIDHLGLGGAQAWLLDYLEVRAIRDGTAVWSLRDRALPETLRRLEAASVPWGTLRLSKANPLGLIRIRRLIRRERPDVLHTHLEYANAFGTLAAASLGRRRPAIVQHIENDPFETCPRTFRALGRLLSPKVDLRVLVSEGLRTPALRAFGGRARRLEVVPPGIDLDRFDPARVDRGLAARLRGGAPRVVGTVGRLCEQKAFHVLLDALPRILRALPGTRCLIVGDGPLRGALESRASEAGVRGAVEFAGYQADVPSALAAMDAFALPSRHEGYGIVYLEAMAMGVPVVGTRVVGSTEAVRDGETGILVAPEDPEAMAGALLRLLSEPDLRDRLREAARASVRRTGGREGMALRIEALYREVAGGRGDRAASSVPDQAAGG